MKHEKSIWKIPACIFGARGNLPTDLRVRFQKSITGVWRLASGNYDGLEECVLEFRDIGEYIVYDGIGFNNDRTHGSYTYDSKQIDMIYTSSGQATFTKVNTNSAPRAFEEREVTARYINDYTVISSQCVSSTETSRVYEIVISKAYKYLENQITKKDRYEYSKRGECWYLTNSEGIGSVDNWHDIIGSYDFSSVTKKTLDISYFDGKTITFDYFAEQCFCHPFESAVRRRLPEQSRPE